MAEIEGNYEDRFQPVADALTRNLDGRRRGRVGGGFLSAGEPVVDIWGGHADAARTRPWERDTIVNVSPTTKTMTFVCALMLADRGELDFDAPVSRYWPEFAAAGKDGVLVRNLMGHTAGLSGWSSRCSPRTSRTGRSAPACWRRRRRGGSPAPLRGTTRSRRAT